MAPQTTQTDAYVLGVGMTPFIKPRKQRMYPELGFEAGVKAMLDAQINYDEVETAVACYCYVRAKDSLISRSFRSNSLIKHIRATRPQDNASSTNLA
jgi:hypothetical protein